MAKNTKKAASAPKRTTTPPPTPTPKPTAKPTPKPTAKPTATPTTRATATPTPKPTSTPTPKPKKGALAKGPSAKVTTKPKPNERKPSAVTFKHEENQAAFNKLNPAQQARYRNILANKGKAAANKFLGQASGAPVVMPGGKRVNEPTQPAAETPYAELPREQQVERAMESGGQAYENLVNRYMTSDPYQIQQRYEPGFTQEMDRARQNVLSQFERRNQEEFARQNLATQQSIVERGLDPNSEAAQALMRANTQRQDLARQEAQSAAEQAAYSVQQQGFGQAYQSGMMPYEQFQAINAPFMAGVGAQYTQEEAQRQRAFEAQQAERTRQAQLQAARIGRSGGGGNAAPDPFAAFNQHVAAQIMQNQGPSAPRPNVGASVVQGITTGATAGLTQNLRR
jgi:hypothetical protein